MCGAHTAVLVRELGIDTANNGKAGSFPRGASKENAEVAQAPLQQSFLCHCGAAVSQESGAGEEAEVIAESAIGW